MVSHSERHLCATAYLLGARGLPLAALTLNPGNIVIAAFGQMTAIPTLGFALADFMCAKHPRWAGACLALMLVKPQLAVAGALLVLLRKDREMFLGGAVASAILFALTLPFFGLASWTAFYDALTGFAFTLGKGATIVDWQWMLSIFALAKHLGLSDAQAYLLHSASAVLALGAAVSRPSPAVIILASLTVGTYNVYTNVTLFAVPATLFLVAYPRHLANLAFLAAYSLLPCLLFYVELDLPLFVVTLWLLLFLAYTSAGGGVTRTNPQGGATKGVPVTPLVVHSQESGREGGLPDEVWMTSTHNGMRGRGSQCSSVLHVPSRGIHESCLYAKRGE